MELLPRVLTLTKHNGYYTSLYTMEWMMGIVEKVVGKPGRVQPITESQVDEIRRLAEMEGAVVKIVAIQDLDKLRELAALGECDFEG